MSRNLKIVVWALALTLFAAAPNPVAARVNCTSDYLLCINDAYRFGGGVARALGEGECFASWIGCTGRKFLFF